METAITKKEERRIMKMFNSNKYSILEIARITKIDKDIVSDIAVKILKGEKLK